MDACHVLQITICPHPSDQEIQVDVALSVRPTEEEMAGAAAAVALPSPPRLPVHLNRTVSGKA